MTAAIAIAEACAPRLRLRHVDAADYADEIESLDKACLPGETPYALDNREWWIVFDGDDPIAYAGAMIHSTWPWGAFLCRAGVLPAYRGRRLQERMIRARVRWARAQGVSLAYTYTSACNAASSNSLIRCGFRVWHPPERWAGVSMVYWRRRLA